MKREEVSTEALHLCPPSILILLCRMTDVDGALVRVEQQRLAEDSAQPMCHRSEIRNRHATADQLVA